MTDNQILAVSLAIPNLLAVLMGILVNNARLSDTNARIGELRVHIDQRFDDMRDSTICAICGGRSCIAWKRFWTLG